MLTPDKARQQETKLYITFQMHQKMVAISRKEEQTIVPALQSLQCQVWVDPCTHAQPRCLLWVFTCSELLLGGHAVIQQGKPMDGMEITAGDELLSREHSISKGPSGLLCVPTVTSLIVLKRKGLRGDNFCLQTFWPMVLETDLSLHPKYRYKRRWARSLHHPASALAWTKSDLRDISLTRSIPSHCTEKTNQKTGLRLVRWIMLPGQPPPY